MHIYEKWYAIEPLKGYALNEDYVTIKTTLEMRIDGNVNFIKKRDFILVIVSSKKPIVTCKLHIYNLLKNRILKKAYTIKRLGNERTIYQVDDKGLTIGVPY